MTNPYQAPDSDISVETSADQPVYVGFWSRIVASIVDNIVMFIVIFILAFIASLAFSISRDEVTDSALMMIIQFVLPIVFVIGFWIARSATPGKMMIGAKIIDVNTGGKPTAGQFILRYLGYFLIFLTLGLGGLWVAFDKRKQGIHDKISSTAVIRV